MAQKWFSTHNNETHLIFYKKKTPKSSYNHRRRNRRNTTKFLMHNVFWDTLYLYKKYPNSSSLLTSTLNPIMLLSAPKSMAACVRNIEEQHEEWVSPSHIYDIILIIKITRGQRALQEDWKTLFAELASRQFHRECEKGTAISQHQTEEQSDDYKIL